MPFEFASIAFAVAILAIITLIWAAATHNRFARLDNIVKESWAGIDVALKRRHDLIPTLVSTVKGLATHEQTLLTKISELRELAAAQLSHNAPQIETENELARQVTDVFARAEAYPELRASQAFLDLQRELANTEDRIAAARRFYNANVREFNTLRESFPATLMAGNRSLKHFFEIDSIDVRMKPEVAFAEND